MKRHGFDAFSLIFGLTFAGIGGVLLDTDVDVGAVAGAGWLPLPLVFLGLLLLAVGLNRVGGDRPADDDPAPVEDPDT